MQCMLEDLGCGDNKYLREGNFGPIDTDEIESSFASVVYLAMLLPCVVVMAVIGAWVILTYNKKMDR